MTSEHPERNETERLLDGVNFSPRTSLGPEITGRARRGEMPRGPVAARAMRLRSMLGIAVSLVMVASAGIISWKSMGAPVYIDSCCQNLDGGGSWDDGFVLEGRGRQVTRLRLYEDRDGSGTFTAGDLVRFHRGPVPALAGSSDARSTRICCADLDGEGPADDGVLVMSEADETVVLAAVYEQRTPGAATPLR